MLSVIVDYGGSSLMSIYQSTYPTDQFGNRFVQNDMGKYIETRPEAVSYTHLTLPTTPYV